MSRSGKAWSTLARRILLGASLPVALLLLWYFGTRGEGVVIPPMGKVFEALTHPFDDPGHLDSLPLADSALISLLRVALGFSWPCSPRCPWASWWVATARRRRSSRPSSSWAAHQPRGLDAAGHHPTGLHLRGLGALRQGIVAVRIARPASARHGLRDLVGRLLPHLPQHGARHRHGAASLHRGGPGQRRHPGADASARDPAGRLPSIMVGVRLGMGRALMVIVAAEFFPGTRRGSATSSPRRTRWPSTSTPSRASW